MSKLSGPINSVVIDYEGRRYTFFSDKHNSTFGSCPGNCKDYDGTKERSGTSRTNGMKWSDVKGTNLDKGGDCHTILYFLNKKFEEGVDFFLEASFVLKDAPLPSFDPENPDYIDKILHVFHDSFLRKKTNLYPRSLLHYVDIRDVFEGTYTKSGTREMVSANPFSGSVVVKEYRNCVEVSDYERITEEGLSLVKFVLENALEYFTSYLKDGEFPVPRDIGLVFDKYRKRLERTKLLNSSFQGRQTSRVGKQLLKLPKETRKKVYDWALEAFERELEQSKQNFSVWQQKYESLRSTTEDAFISEFETVRMYPITCLVALSSVIMDVYTLSRSLYHQRSKETIYYCGAAHTENYLNFFLKNGARILERRQSQDGFERCVL